MQEHMNTPVSINATEQLWLEVHIIETDQENTHERLRHGSGAESDILVDYLVPVGLDLAFRNIIQMIFAARLPM